MSEPNGSRGPGAFAHMKEAGHGAGTTTSTTYLISPVRLFAARTPCPACQLVRRYGLQMILGWPDVFVVGAPKCGTTSLHQYLGSHPDVFTPPTKELHYYTRDVLRRNVSGPGDEHVLRSVTTSAESYRRYFRRAARFRRSVDVSPSYLYWRDVVAPSIAEDQPDALVIIMLRDPVEKAYSQYLHQRRSQVERLTFEDALDAERQRTAERWSDMWYYVKSSIYQPQVQAYLDVFGAERVHFVVAEELAESPQAVMHDVYGFLGVATDHAVHEVRRNATGEVRSRRLARLLAQPNPAKRLSHFVLPETARFRIGLRLTEANTGRKPPMSARARGRLTETFSEDVAALEDLLGRRLPWQSSPARR